MIKLTPLEAVSDLRNSGLIKDDIVVFNFPAFIKRLDIIETALKDNGTKEYIKRVEDILFKHNLSGLNELDAKLSNFEKKLKALEIIKEKEVNVYMLLWYFTYSSYEQYVDAFIGDFDDSVLSDKLLTQKEYDLLKEVLNND